MKNFKLLIEAFVKFFVGLLFVCGFPVLIVTRIINEEVLKVTLNTNKKFVTD